VVDTHYLSVPDREGAPDWGVRAARVHEWGSAPVLEEAPDPQPAPGETVVRIAAAGAGHFDLTVAAGEVQPRPRLPFVPGTDGAGQVVASRHFQSNCWVRIGGGGLGLSRDGTWAELVAVPDEALHPIPAGVDPAVAACFYVPASAAFLALHEVGRFRAGERVAVTGASGAVGSLVVQLALHAGASEVVGVVSSPAKASAVPSGATVVVGQGAAVVESLGGGGNGLDLLVDTVGGGALRELVAAVSPGGRIVLVGYTAGREVTFDLPTLVDADVSLLPLNLLHRPARTREAASVVLEMLREGTIVLPVTTFALKELSGALDALTSGSNIGRVALLPHP
jgi:NADPH:quinone reductase-like Zn-dependent oxidoreductase